jgi:asparagine synthase (glutamine-hydrolysing)
MCGIAGIVNAGGRPVSRAELQPMCDAMVHRGPDDEGLFADGDAGLGARRLSIIDLAAGHQPVRNEDGSVWVVLNGEIYNFKQLRRQLKRHGHAFRTGTDTEVIVHLYEEHGADCVRHLRGMFAFAVWDRRTRSLLLARDRLGIKPLYYAEVDGRLVFGSELKVVLQAPGVERRLHWPAVDHLVSFLTTPATESIVAGVRKLEPGHTLTFSRDGGLRKQQYWDLRFAPERGRSTHDCVERLRELLTDSVGLHLVSDVPVGAFLSGGIDSSAVVAAMAQLSRHPVRTFSIGFHDGDHDERRHAREVARRFGTDHRELVLEPDITGLVDDLVWHLDEPFGDASAIPTYMVSRLAAQHVTVVLSGDGGDELFAGYDKYVVERRERRYEKLAAPVRGLLGAAAATLPEGATGRNFLRHFSLAGAERYLDALAFFRPDQKRRLFQPEALRRMHPDGDALGAGALLAAPGRDWLSSLQYLDAKRYLPLDILAKVDRMSMAHSLEARVPLLDHPLVEYAASIPPELKLNGTTKYIFKQAMRGILPDDVIDRPKQGFAVPLGRWFRGELGGFLREHLLSQRCRERGVFNPDYVGKLVALHERGRPLDFQLWTLLSFELWCRRFLDPPRVRPGRAARAMAPPSLEAGHA